MKQLKDLKVGDTAYEDGRHSQTHVVAFIGRKWIRTDLGYKFDRNTGISSGTQYGSGRRLYATTSGERAAADHATLLAQINAIDFDSCTTAQLRDAIRELTR